MTTHSSILAWRILWTEEPGRLQFMGLQRVGHSLVTKPPPQPCLSVEKAEGIVPEFRIGGSCRFCLLEMRGQSSESQCLGSVFKRKEEGDGECRFSPASLGGLRSILQRKQWQPTPVLLPGKSHGWRSLVGCSPWGQKSWTQLSDFPFTFHFDALEKEMATHSSVLAWRIPGTEKPGGLPSIGSHRVGHD